MWVRILRKCFTPDGVSPVGAQLNLTVADAKLLIGAGKAKAIPDPALEAEQPPAKADKPHKVGRKAAPAEPNTIEPDFTEPDTTEPDTTEQESTPC